MRVIAGKARRIQLKTIEGLSTRPTTDRIKETLFNIINFDLADSTFLDLYAGSGAIGIEALSRGAKKSVFVENNKKAVQCIKDNLVATKLDEQANVITGNVLDALPDLKGETFDFVFMDAPYNHGYEKDVLIKLIELELIDDNSMIIIEADIDDDFSYVTDLGYGIHRDKLYKTNRHLFLKKQ